MTSRGTRKSAPQRRAEIVAAAGELAVAEGLDTVTLRRVAERLGVVPGLVSHYFPAVDDLVAEAFADAATREIDEVFAAVDAAGSPAAGMREWLRQMLTAERDGLSLLWLDAWNTARRRPALHAEVARQMRAWQERVAAVVGAGIAGGAFVAVDGEMAALRILAVVDGLSIQAVMRTAVDYAMVRDLVVATAERELGLAPGTLDPADSA